MIMKEKKVVVTGLGVVSSIGIGWQEFWGNLLAGKSGISRVSSFDTSEYDRHNAGEVKIFKSRKFIAEKKSKRLGRSSQMAIAASLLALEDAKIVVNDQISKKGIVCVGTTTGEIGIFIKYHDNKFRGEVKFDSNLISVFPANSVASNIAIQNDFRSQNITFGTACASGNYAISYAFDLIKSGQADYALVGGSDVFSRMVFAGFCKLFAVAPQMCQPFDKNRKGMIPAEGAGCLFLESLMSAKERNVDIYAEILGYGLSCDAFHMTKPSPEGIFKAIKKAIVNSDISPSDIDYVSAHGTGTRENDIAECAAVKKILKNNVPMSSIKSMLGHTLGAASAIEAISCCLSVSTDQIPPTINYETPDPLCDVDCVPNVSRNKKVRVVLNNSLAFGGNNCCVIFKKID